MIEIDKTYILGIETSCDETCASVFFGKSEKSSVISSQIDIHRKYGGVVPEVASRNHTMDLPTVVEQAVQSAGINFYDIGVVAVTFGAGLNGALLCGVSFAKGLAYGLGLPLIGINHIQAHIDSNYIGRNLEPPFLALVVSGGHTSIVRVDDYNSYIEVESTLDDACGEAFDKVARLLCLGYPGGPIIEKTAKMGIANITLLKDDTNALKGKFISYSGLKTATINYVNRLKQSGIELDNQVKADICASFMQYSVEILIQPLLKCLKKYGYKKVVLAGGVAANQYLKNKLLTVSPSGVELFVPPLKYCTDNASMVCMRAYNLIKHDVNTNANIIMSDTHIRSSYKLNANSGLSISENA